MGVRLIAASVALPLISHVARQAVACAPSAPPPTYAVFLAVYGASLIVHARWVDAHATVGARVALVGFALTLAVCVWAHAAGDDVAFLVAWGAHAVPSAALWPVAYRFVAAHTRSRTLLTLWSLQGTAGDALGCVSGLFDRPPSALCASALGAGVALSFVALFARPPTVADRERLVQRSDRAGLALAVAASACTKVLTYTASDWMPTLGLDYMWYNAGGVAGTLLAGVLSDVSRRLPNLERLTVLCTSVALIILVVRWDRADAGVAIAFGALASLASTAVSVCVCTQLADGTGAYGRTTALLDGGATLAAAAVQVVARQHFRAVQLSAALALALAAAGLAIRPRLSARSLQPPHE